MPTINPTALAHELMAAHATGQTIERPPSARGTAFDLPTAYLVEAELARLKKADGHAAVGRKIGYANKAVWRALKLDTLVWAHMYDDTVRYTDRGVATLSLAHPVAPKIEPEIVFKLKTGLTSTDPDASAVLEAVEWLALGFEIIDCVFADWKFQPPDFVAAFGLHVALVVGEPVRVVAGNIPILAGQLPGFKVRLLRNGQLVQEGSGKNSLRSPALCLGELAACLARQSGAEPLAAGEIVSSGTLTESQPIAPGEVWTAEVEGLDLPAITLHY